MGLLGRRHSTSLFVISELSNTFFRIPYCLWTVLLQNGGFLDFLYQDWRFLLELEIVFLNSELAKSITILGNYCLYPECLKLSVKIHICALFVHQIIIFCIRFSFMSINNLINLHDFDNANMKWFSFKNLLIMLTSVICN